MKKSALSLFLFALALGASGLPAAALRVSDQAALPAAAQATEPGGDSNDASDDSKYEHSHVRPVQRRRTSASSDEVRIMGSVTVDEGRIVRGDAVAVMGNLTVNGAVQGDAVGVMSNTTINGTVDGDAVAVMGNLTLGPKARILGNAVCVGGTITRAPGAVVMGSVNEQGAGITHVGVPVTAWWTEALSHGRLLAVGRHLAALWIINVVLIAFYALLALVFPGGIRRCGDTLVQRPGIAILAAFLTVLALPLVFVLLLITIVGIPVALLFLPLAIIVGTLFGRAAIYGLVGRSIFRSGLHPALAVLVGAAFFLCLYVLPVLGLALWFFVGFLGLGLSVATLFGPKSTPPAAPPPPVMPSAPSPGESATNEGMPESPSAPADVVAAVPSVASAPTAPPLLAAVEPAPTAPTESGTERKATAPVPPPLTPLALIHPRAGFWLRTGALAIDLILVSAIFNWCVAPLLHGAFGAKGSFLPILAAYGALLWKLRGSTIGGIVFGLKVVRLDDRPIDWGTAVVRALACFLSLLVAGLGFIWVAFDPEKQSWHDKIAGTTVVKASKPVSLV